MAKVLNTNELNEMLEKKETFVVDFYADWCGPCKMLAPVIEELASEFEGKVTIAKVNTDQSPDLAQKFGISGIPTILFFKNGEVANTHVGYIDKDSLKEKIDSL